MAKRFIVGTSYNEANGKHMAGLCESSKAD
jgi:hypothetical protein